MQLKDRIKKFFDLKTIIFFLTVPLISILAYRSISEPLLTKTIVKESLIQTMSEQPEIILDGIMGQLTADTETEITEEEKDHLKEEISKIIMENYSKVTEKFGLDIKEIMNEVDVLRQSSATKEELKGLKEEVEKIKTDLAENLESNKALDDLTKAEIDSIVDSIDELEKELDQADEVDSSLADSISDILNRLAALKKDMNTELDKLRKQIERLKKDSSDTMENQINNVQSQIDALNALHNSLDFRLAEFIRTVDIDSLNEIIAGFALSISSLDTGLSSVRNDVEQIDLSMIALEDMLNSNIESLDENLKGEIRDVLAKMKKLSEDVYDKSIVDKHIEAIQSALDNIMANAGELDEELQNKFSQAQKDLEDLKQETESGYYDKIAVNNKITEINSSLSEGLAQISDKADKNLKDAITKVESDLTDFGKNVETAYKQEINKEVSNLRTELQDRLNDVHNSMVSLENMLNSNIDSVDAALKKEIEDVLAKMKKLSEDVYDKSIVDKHIAAIQSALDNIMANAGELDEELQNKFNQAQKDLEDLKQETESGYYDKIAVNNKITEINSSLSEGLAQISDKADKNLKDAITKVEADLNDFGRNVEAAYKQAISEEVSNLKKELQDSINAAAEANRKNTEDITELQGEAANIGSSITQLIARLNTMDGNYTDLTAQLTAVKNNLQYGYYTKEQMDALMANIQTALDTIKADVNKNTDKANANATAITDLQTSLGNLNNSLNEKTTALQTNINNLGNNVTNLGTRVDNCFQSVSDGKRLLASAITGKGIDTPADATFQQMANNVNGLVTMSSNPSVLFDTSSWTAPYDCIAVMSWSVNWKANDDYSQTATVTLSGVKSWDMGWGGTHDSSWHDYGGNGNVTWQAKAGQTYSLSFGTTSDSRVLTWGWNSRTWIVPGARTMSTNSLNAAPKTDSYIYKIQKLEKDGTLYEPVPWKNEEDTENKSSSTEQEETSTADPSEEKPLPEETYTEEQPKPENEQEQTENNQSQTVEEKETEDQTIPEESTETEI